MKKGTKSLLFGVHQFLWHPITVWIAWMWLFRELPNWREMVCIVIHDWGYWGKANMDDEEGERHPEVGAAIAGWLFDRPLSCKSWNPLKILHDAVLWDHRSNGDYLQLCLFHSRHYARNACQDPSSLCWADKLSIIFEPWWLYLPRAWASGELAEYRKIAAGAGFIPLTASHREWYRWIKNRLSTLGKEKRGDVVPYVNPVRN